MTRTRGAAAGASHRELRLFGLLTGAAFGVLGGVLYWQLGTHRLSWALWGFGTLWAAVYYAVPALRIPMYSSWMTAVAPIGHVVSFALFALIYYLVVTPIGLMLRAVGRSPLDRLPDPEAESYWVDRAPSTARDRYFRQY